MKFYKNLLVLSIILFSTNSIFSECYPTFKDTVFMYEGFRNPDLFQFKGSSYIKDDQISLTRLGGSYTKGAAWYKTKMDVVNGFLTEFSFDTDNGRRGNAANDGSLPGADGLTFVIQNAGFQVLGGPGHYLGYHNIPNSLVIEIDLYENSYRINPNHKIYNDPNGNHIAIQTNGQDANSCAHQEYTLDINDKILEIKNDGTKYYLRVFYDNSNYTMSVCLADENKIFAEVLFVDNIDLETLLDLDDGKAIIGFTSGTGDAYQDHNITSWMWCGIPDIPDDPCHESMFEYLDFADIYDLNFVGKARQSDDVARLTRAKTLQTGAMWHTNPVPVKKGFTTEFSFRMTDGTNGSSTEGSEPGADGIAFVIQNLSNNAIGTYGGGLGYEGITNSIAIEYDLYHNSDTQIITKHDENGNHISVHSGGMEANSALHDENYEMGTVWDILEMKSDATVYWSKIIYRNSNKLDIYLSENRMYGDPVLTLTDVDISSILELREQEYAYVGFTSATASAYQAHDILYWYFCPDQTDAILSVGEYSKSDAINIYPNPANSQITIDCGFEGVDQSIRIINNLSQIVFEEALFGNKTININHLSSGTYYMIIESDGKYYSKPFSVIK